MKTLKEYFHQAREEKWAIGHFNFSMAEQLRAFVEIANELKAPLMVGTSEGEANFIGYDQAVALVKSYQKQGFAVFLNWDNHKSFESEKKAIDAGYDTIHIDVSKKPFEENMRITKSVVEYSKTIGRDIMIEGELGYLKGTSEIQENVEITPDDFTKPEQAKLFVESTGIDRLAIAFGNAHGIITNQEERLDINVLKSVREAVPNTHIVLHGASGLKDNNVREAIANGIDNVHINTELRIAYHDALENELAKKNESTTPYKFVGPAVEATKKLVKEKLELFGSVNRL